VDTIDSGGTEPISLTQSGHLLYVLNEDSGNIAGFRFSDDGDLSSVPHSSQPWPLPARPASRPRSASRPMDAY
jgi:6-phosphogluconolactonase (cycloisomerase 2 family)